MLPPLRPQRHPLCCHSSAQERAGTAIIFWNLTGSVPMLYKTETACAMSTNCRTGGDVINWRPARRHKEKASFICVSAPWIFDSSTVLKLIVCPLCGEIVLVTSPSTSTRSLSLSLSKILSSATEKIGEIQTNRMSKPTC